MCRVIVGARGVYLIVDVVRVYFDLVFVLLVRVRCSICVVFLCRARGARFFACWFGFCCWVTLVFRLLFLLSLDWWVFLLPLFRRPSCFFLCSRIVANGLCLGGLLYRICLHVAAVLFVRAAWRVLHVWVSFSATFILPPRLGVSIYHWLDDGPRVGCTCRRVSSRTTTVRCMCNWEEGLSRVRFVG